MTGPSCCRAGSTLRWLSQAVRFASRPASRPGGTSVRRRYRLLVGLHPRQRPHSGGGPAQGSRMGCSRQWIEDVLENELEICMAPKTSSRSSCSRPAARGFGPISPGEQVREPDAARPDHGLDLQRPQRSGRTGTTVSRSSSASFEAIRSSGSPRHLEGAPGGQDRAQRRVQRLDRGGRSREGPVKSQWRLPSFFGPSTFVDDSTLSSLACGPRVIGVANLDEARETIAASSSQGPTRDGRMKPEIAAPGTRGRRRLRL